MRIIIKGGQWKNTEDEILKAAVMKYGKNQWARISSLLVRKSAKQCKARWYEWLDPSIKKTEWTRDEDEKLLHLAKLMPTQWRTIAPIVGRTPAQCLERYERLLDAACSKEDGYERNEDPRRLRPGEIDPNPESKPARPDAVDMDEEEKEMLSEARARLANTKGKKAKRKARERQLEEARRLASLQKRRELKAAGIEQRQRFTKKMGIDYNAEIPFEKRPAPGFYDTSSERQVADPMAEQNFKPVTVEDMEGKRRDDIEEALMKRDSKRQKILERHDAPSAVAQVNAINESGMAVRKRSKLMLPSPQVSERELEEVAKMGASGLVDASDLDAMAAGGSAVTQGLLPTYQQTPSQTPMRTPMRTPAAGGGGGDAILLEAQNLFRMNSTQTPLVGGENPELNPSDFSGVTPRHRVAATPNPLATPRVGDTPLRMGGITGGATPRATPFRDGLSINDADSLSSGGVGSERAQQSLLKRELREGLSSLPAPKNEYQVEIPDLPEEEPMEAEFEEDAVDREKRLAAEAAARDAYEKRLRSQAVQRELPRPSAAPDAAAAAETDPQQLIATELHAMLAHDCAAFPGAARKAKKTREPPPPLERFEESELLAARALLNAEAEALRLELGHESLTADEVAAVAEESAKSVIWLHSKGAFGPRAGASNSDRVKALDATHAALRAEMGKEAKKAGKLEHRVEMMTAGYKERARKLTEALGAGLKGVQDAALQLESYRMLQEQEERAAPARIEALADALKAEQHREVALQERYAKLQAEFDGLQKSNNNAAAAA
mmetsp:Transcript_7720/g.25602  ORF Transcript_7720/g.25602 Transcript_7720/m.25602 type:complete len:783 (-) Transcript_7720:84-2432(-)|eukprot:CAMPEP_0170138934 /NCGR_PEP_ID=MMETSP0033_2-20121228/5297_1 /TAXON_ID=195969 /ORGANISM="Dolichomastix tenuilepis, Strain CCMP3274" /LENGTH=782 /DNA_ID=CAMNT_0010375005 /DNA_START=61 /DNA_END=2409 /DNA_ORIENTATION=+